MAAGLWTVFLLDAAFILLSGASQEARRCYWCGPLAEQVHRSRRSGPCGASNNVTVCEPGYNYCAVVATSPPRVESRYCVKMYQDECYPLYCNSTKTWKMTCPCRGDLCNGANTERETEAFALLPKLVAKTNNARIKKRTANPVPHLIKHDGKNKIIGNGDAEMHNMPNLSSNDVNNITYYNKLIVTENDVMPTINGNSSQESENVRSDQPTNIVIEHHHNEENYVQSTVVNQDDKQTTTNQLIEIEIHVGDQTEESNKIKENDQPCTDLPATTIPDEANKNTEPIKNEVGSIATTAKSASNNESPVITTEVNIVVQSEAMKTTQIVEQDVIEIKFTDKPHTELPIMPAEIIPNDQAMNPEEQIQKDAPKDVQLNVIEIKPTNRPHTGPPIKPTELIANGQPMNPEEQMQNDAPPTSPADSIHTLETTEVTKNEKPSTEDIAKANDGMPTAEALQQNGSPLATAAPVPMTEKPTELTTTEATTIPTVTITNNQMTKITTTPASKRKNNSVRVTFSYTLLLICIVYL